MGKKTQEAKDALDYMLFHNVYNHPDVDGWEMIFEGDNYVLWNQRTNKLYHFEVIIKKKAWDSLQAREDQEWDI